MNVNLLLLKSKLTWKAGCLTLIVILNASAFSYGVTGPGAAWQYVRKITLAPATSTNNLQVKVTLAVGQYGNMNASGNDLRFYDSNNNLCNYWIETWNTSGASVIWVKVPVSGTNSLYLFYGNAGAGAQSNGDNTFLFYDDFSGSSLNTTKWGSFINGTAAVISVSGGSVTLNCGTQTGSVIHGAQIIAKTSFNVSDGVIIETALGGQARSRCGGRAVMCGASEMASTSSSFFQLDVSGLKYAAEQIGRSGQWGFPGTQGNGTSTVVYDYLTSENSTLASGTTMSVVFTNSNIYYYRAGSLVGTSNSTPPTGTLYPILSSLRVPDCMGSNSNSVIIDYIRLRKYATTDPTATMGGQSNNNLSASIGSQTNVLCNGLSNGSATVAVSGGSSPYTYSWSNGQNGVTATGLSPATYAVTVTDNIGLSTGTSATITQPAAVSALVTNKTDINCFNGNDGSISISASGGTPPYYFSVESSPAWTINSYPSNYTFTGLKANVPYKIRVKDSNGCESLSIP